MATTPQPEGLPHTWRIIAYNEVGNVVHQGTYRDHTRERVDALCHLGVETKGWASYVVELVAQR